jgi:glycosyltransferase involved in cell wall biosynthesis
MPIPILFLSDGVTAQTGLARITNDLATRVHNFLPEYFRVGALGYGGSYSRSVPFPQYQMEMKDWVVHNLPEVWRDFAGDERGIVLTIWDPSRLLWFSRPENCEDKRLQIFLKNPPFVRWGYFPMDATGIADRLTAILRHTIEGYDRVLAYSAWAEAILRRTITRKDLLDGLTNIPHGIDTSVFHPRHRLVARHGFGEKIGARNNKGKYLSIPDDTLMIGIVGTNQARKDWGLALASVARVKERRERPTMIWCHTDVLERFWSLPALLNDFNLLAECVVTTVPFSDEQMAWNYSACDITLGHGLGEGYGYCCFESLACGTPCIHGDYGGAAEHLPDSYKIQPQTFRLEGPYCVYRPVFSADEWAERIFATPKGGQNLLPDYLSWNMLWRRWKQWFMAGIGKEEAECQSA